MSMSGKSTLAAILSPSKYNDIKSDTGKKKLQYSCTSLLSKPKGCNEVLSRFGWKINIPYS